MKVWSTHRPVSIGTYPREYGVKEIHNFNRREWVEEIHNYAWGYIDYEKDLPKEEQDHYDLRPEIKVDPKCVMNGAACVKEKDFDKKTDSENLRDAKTAVFALDPYTRAMLKSVFSGHGDWVADKSSS